jgi:anthranilate phosphoribosyltransferase
VVALEDGRIRRFTIDPQALGIARPDPAALAGGDAAHNAAALRQVLAGERTAYRDIAALNAAAALVIAGKATEIAEGLAQAYTAIDSGAAGRVLDRLVTVSQV